MQELLPSALLQKGLAKSDPVGGQFLGDFDAK